MTPLILISNFQITTQQREKNVLKWDRILRRESLIISQMFEKSPKQERNLIFIAFLIGLQAMLFQKI